MDAKPEDTRPLPWPIFIIDFEASSLTAGSYPIEVGVCRWTSPAQTIEGCSTLIKPTPEWSKDGTWWSSSQEIHGIGAAELRGGLDPSSTIDALNDIIGENIAFCDGGAHDLRWLQPLVNASALQPTWALGDFNHLALRLDQLGYMRLVRWLDRSPCRHRARDDAERLMKAIARRLKLEHGTSRDI